MVEARMEVVAASETARFQKVLEEFLDVVNKVGAQEPRVQSPNSLLHVVSVGRLQRRMDELADH